MQYIVCNECGFLNEPIDNSCKRCQSSLQGIVPLLAEDAAAAARQFRQQPTGGSHFDAAGAASSALSYVTSNLKPLSGEYPYALRYISWMQASALWCYVINLLVTLVVVLVIIGGGMGVLKASGGAGNKVLVMGGYLLIAALAAVSGFFIARFNYMLMMALPDFLTCFLRIEANTRPVHRTE